MMNVRCACLVLWLMLASVVAVGQSTDQRFLAGLRQRGLFELAETYCADRLKRPDLPESQRAELPAGFFGRLLKLVKTLHRCGVAQRDIGAGDVLVTGAGEPGLVDFSVSVRQRRGPFNALLFRSATAQDLRRVARLHQRFSPGDLTEEERGYLEHEPALNRWAHRLRRLVPGRKR